MHIVPCIFLETSNYELDVVGQGSLTCNLKDELEVHPDKCCLVRGQAMCFHFPVMPDSCIQCCSHPGFSSLSKYVSECDSEGMVRR